MSEILEQTTFLKDVISGLQAKSKRISSKYFYDQKGSEIFQQIMDMEEYYLPACEKSILENESENIAALLKSDSIQVLELGAGDGTKTSIILEKFMVAGKNIHYFPMDISADILKFNQKTLANQLPKLAVTPIVGDYHQTLKEFPKAEEPKLILFLGSNIGNFRPQEAIDFLKFVKECMDPGDHFLLASDLKKNPSQILRAYSDPGGLTKKFNMNLLERINTELDGDFNLKGFDHYATYNPLDGLAQSFLVSLKEQEVNINGKTFPFDRYEVIHTEISKKYGSDELKQLMETAGFKFKKIFYDTNNWYALALGEAI
ncbi:L-histidine N(alpha)-methyltransferase [Lunatibacter salilacus]|uniref:L-histidine N(alpha)-methyltransferase n=1 Tax=Lunatibacter salilacus TaxID=2483804 RepID=UPI00131CDD31|nr:L-histidine N(alpha)-methyltransferase [Lunatibacter salilacus]